MCIVEVKLNVIHLLSYDVFDGVKGYSYTMEYIKY
jgi:hypothetical protein